MEVMSASNGQALSHGAMQSPACSLKRSSRAAFRDSITLGLAVSMIMPSSAAAVHDGISRPEAMDSTTHTMHEVPGRSPLRLQSAGISKPASIAASMTVAPSSVWTGRPFIVSLIFRIAGVFPYNSGLGAIQPADITLCAFFPVDPVTLIRSHFYRIAGTPLGAPGAADAFIRYPV